MSRIPLRVSWLALDVIDSENTKTCHEELLVIWTKFTRLCRYHSSVWNSIPITKYKYIFQIEDPFHVTHTYLHSIHEQPCINRIFRDVPGANGLRNACRRIRHNSDSDACFLFHGYMGVGRTPSHCARCCEPICYFMPSACARWRIISQGSLPSYDVEPLHHTG